MKRLCKLCRHYRGQSIDVQTHWCRKKKEMITGNEAPDCPHYSPKTHRADFLERAEALICGDRDQQYGDPLTNFEVIAKLWSVRLGVDVTPAMVAILMCDFKIARFWTGGYAQDHFDDLVGYAAIAGQLAAEDKS